MTTNARDEQWMRIALLEARKAMEEGELPIAAVVASDTGELGRAQTKILRQGSITAHAELLALASAGWSIPSAIRPVTLYTTLEPCLMCMGAAIQCAVDEIVFAMRAAPDGATPYLSLLAEAGLPVPTLRRNVLLREAIQLMRETLVRNPDHPKVNYARTLLSHVEPSSNPGSTPA